MRLAAIKRKYFEQYALAKEVEGRTYVWKTGPLAGIQFELGGYVEGSKQRLRTLKSMVGRHKAFGASLLQGLQLKFVREL